MRKKNIFDVFRLKMMEFFGPQKTQKKILTDPRLVF